MILIAISHRRKSSVIAIPELLYTNLDSIAIISKYKKLPTAIKKRGFAFANPLKDSRIKKSKDSRPQRASINLAEDTPKPNHSRRRHRQHRRCRT